LREHREAFGVVAHVGEERERGTLDALTRAPRADGLGDASHDVVHLAIDHDGVEALFAPEVLVDDRLADLRAGRDLFDRGGLVAALGEDRAADLDELRAAFEGGEPGAALGFARGELGRGLGGCRLTGCGLAAIAVTRRLVAALPTPRQP